MSVFLDPGRSTAGPAALVGGVAVPTAWSIAGGRVLMVAYTFRRSGDAEAIRIISARRASRRERAAYAAQLIFPIFPIHP